MHTANPESISSIPYGSLSVDPRRKQDLKASKIQDLKASPGIDTLPTIKMMAEEKDQNFTESRSQFYCALRFCISKAEAVG